MVVILSQERLMKICYFVLLIPIQLLHIFIYICVCICIYIFFSLMVGYKSVNILFPVKVTCLGVPIGLTSVGVFVLFFM